jgi:RNA polymerase sigma-70 factor (ECF subfamily)
MWESSFFERRACDHTMIEIAAPEPERPTTATPHEATVSEDFAAFYDREIRSVVGLTYVLSGSRAGAEDLAQDAFLAAYRHWNRISLYENPGAWVRRVAANRAISAGRRRVAEAKTLVRLSGARITFRELSVDNKDLWSAVRQLPPRQAQVIALRYWDHRTTHEIAEILELSEATIKSHLQRARQTLADTYPKD